MSNIMNGETTPILTPIIEKKSKKFSRIFPNTDDDDIVISGIAGKFPNCHNVSEFEHSLYNKIDMVDDDERRWRHTNPEIPKRSGKIYDVEKFDPTFFGIHYKQAHSIDPQTRILIETAYEAVIDSGINPIRIRGSKTGVYIGATNSESEKYWLYEKQPADGLGATDCCRAMMANRISYCLGLNGPSFVLDNACSSSLYALDNAFNALRNGEIDAAIVGATNLILHPSLTLQFARLGVLAADGFCRPFDQNASGYTRSDAITCIFLQRKVDAKRAYASLVYSKTNSDGYKPNGITHPSAKAQQMLLNEFYEESGISPENLAYLEAHGTGTVAGDPEEFSSIDNALCSRRTLPLLVGSCKSNMGHSEASSGICALVKSCLAFQTGKIAPNINFKEVKSDVPALLEGRMVVVKDVTEFEKPYIAVNSFGFGGTNAHALLKSCVKTKSNNGLPSDDIPRLVTWAGRNEESINRIMDDIAKRPLDAEFIALLQNTQKDEVAGMVFRGFGIFRKNGTKEAITEFTSVQHYTGVKRPIVWVFSGMGSQWPKMGAALMIIPQFRQSIERCHATLLEKGLNLIEILTSKDPTTFDNILHSFVGIAAVQIALIDVLRSLNMEPDYIIGHSVGELGCGYADGGFTLEQMILAAYYRGKVSLDVKKIKGAMVAVGMGYKTIINILPESIEVACHNGDNSCVISGPEHDIAMFVTELKSKEIFAKEVPCCNIAYHSRYIADMGPVFVKYLRQIIPNPKRRSAKWLSSSVPKSNWNQLGSNLCSAEYHTNNLLTSVLFEETLALLPTNSLTIEIAPHGLLQGILKRSMPGGLHFPLAQRGNENNDLYFLSALGKLFTNGITFPVENLYPAVKFPVSRGTPSISSLICWDHSEDFFVPKYEDSQMKSSGERSYTLSLANDDDKYISGHVIDGKVLIPPAQYLQYVWETFSLMHHRSNYVDVPVEFEDVKFLRSTIIPFDGAVELNIMIHYGTGEFEITESRKQVATGRISECQNLCITQVHNSKEVKNSLKMEQKDFYMELKLRGHNYSGPFEVVKEARTDGLGGKIEWNQNWVTFLDGMLQIHTLRSDSRSLRLPKMIRKLRIAGANHLDMMSKLDTLCNVYVDHIEERIVAGGIEIIGLQASTVERRLQTDHPVLEKYQFLSHFPSPVLTASEAVRACIQIALENTAMPSIKVVEVNTTGRQSLLLNFLESIDETPLITGDYVLLSEKTLNDLPPSIRVENENLTTQTNCQFVVVEANDTAIKTAEKCLSENGYLVVRESKTFNINNLVVPENFKTLGVFPLDNNFEVIVLLQRDNVTKKIQLDPQLIQVSDTDTEFEWITLVQQAIGKERPVLMYSYNENINGLIGFAKTLRKEPYGNLVTFFFIDDTEAPAFSLDNPLYAKQYELGLALNIYCNGKWGTYHYLKLNTAEKPRISADHIYANVAQHGDLSSIRWFEGSLNPNEADIRIVYSSLNFRDVALATGLIPADIYSSGRQDQSCSFGLEYSGINVRTGCRIMSMAIYDGMASYAKEESPLTWKVPEHWSLQEAATVPVVYSTVYYAFFMSTDIRKGKSILIHAGAGGIGIAAIRTALAYNLEVFTTCSSPQKKQFLLNMFPQLKESHIGNSRDTSFEEMIQRETNGKGVDFVLNSLAGDKLMASVRCLGKFGQFLEIGKLDMINSTKLDMNCFLKCLKFHAVSLDCLGDVSDNEIAHLKEIIDNDIASGIVQPLPATVFPAQEIEQAFRHLAAGKHMGKVLLKIRDEPDSKFTMPVEVVKQVYFNPHMSYIVPGGLGGFGLEFVNWMIIRGARNIVVSSRRGITQSYQSYRIGLWKTHGCKVKACAIDISTLDGCVKLLNEAEEMAPIGGIFNLAVALRDTIFVNHTKDSFKESFGPKSVATMFLDQLSRKRCPQLQHFVMFSSVTSGRGNAGQTNYGMTNSVMEKIIETRTKCGYPGKVIQWGAVGDVGLTVIMANGDAEVKIAGTQQQRISSCLQTLDNLLFAPDVIVSSIVVAEKSGGHTENESVTETVMNIMGIRNLNSLSLGTTLSDLGMDSLVSLEIKHKLEYKFDLTLTVDDLRSMTFQKLQGFAENLKVQSCEKSI